MEIESSENPLTTQSETTAAVAVAVEGNGTNDDDDDNDNNTSTTAVEVDPVMDDSSTGASVAAVVVEGSSSEPVQAQEITPTPSVHVNTSVPAQSMPAGKEGDLSSRKRPRQSPISTPDLATGKRQRKANSLYGDFEVESSAIPTINTVAASAIPASFVSPKSPTMARASVVSPQDSAMQQQQQVRRGTSRELIASPEQAKELSKKLPKGYAYEVVPTVATAMPVHAYEPTATTITAMPPPLAVQRPEIRHNGITETVAAAPVVSGASATMAPHEYAAILGGVASPNVHKFNKTPKSAKPPKEKKIRPPKAPNSAGPMAFGAASSKPGGPLKQLKKQLKLELSQIDTLVAGISQAIEVGEMPDDNSLLATPQQTFIPAEIFTTGTFGGPSFSTTTSAASTILVPKFETTNTAAPAHQFDYASLGIDLNTGAVVGGHTPGKPGRKPGRAPKPKRKDKYDDDSDEEAAAKRARKKEKLLKAEQASATPVTPFSAARPGQRRSNPYDIYDDEQHQTPMHPASVPAARSYGGAHSLAQQQQQQQQQHQQQQPPPLPLQYTPVNAAAPTSLPTSSLNLDPQLLECHRILVDLRNHQYAGPFNQPVDPIALNILDYFDVVKNPMDLGTVVQNLEAGDYLSPEEVADDVALIWRNCRSYNTVNHPITKMADALEHYFNRRYQRAFNKMPPTSTPASVAGVRTSLSGMPHSVGSPPTYAAPAPLPPPPMPAPVMDQSKIVMASTINELRDSMKVLREELLRMRKEQASKPVVAPAPPPRELRELPPARERRPPPPPPAPEEAHRPRGGARGAQPKAAKEMTFEEKANLSNAINSLEQSHLGRVVQIIQAAMPQLAKNNPEEIEIDIDALDASTLRKLEQFVKSVQKQQVVAAAPAKRKGGRKSKEEMQKEKQEEEKKRLIELQQQLAQQGLLPPIPGAPDMGASSTQLTSNDGSMTGGDIAMKDENDRIDVDDTGNVHSSNPAMQQSNRNNNNNNNDDSSSSSSSSSSDSDSDSDDDDTITKPLQPVPISATAELPKDVELNVESWQPPAADNAQDRNNNGSSNNSGNTTEQPQSSAWSQFQNLDSLNKRREKEREEDEERERQAKAKREEELRQLDEERKAELRRQEEEKLRAETEARAEQQRMLEQEKESERLAREQTAKVNMLEQSTLMSSFELDPNKPAVSNPFKLRED